MNNLIKFLQAIHVAPETITALQVEGDVTNLDELKQKYIDSRNAYYESTILKDKEKEFRDKAIESYNIKVKKTINDFLGMGLTNAQMDEIKDLETMAEKAKEFKANLETTLRSSTDETLKKELDTYKLTATERQKKIEELENARKAFEDSIKSDYDKKIQSYEAKSFLNKLIADDKELPDVPGRDFTLDAIRERILGSYIVKPDGTLTNLDGTLATHPEKEVTINHVSDLYGYFKNKAGLVKQSNGGSGKDVTEIAGIKVEQKLSPEALAQIEKMMSIPKM